MSIHQGSALSPLLFVIVMEAISREFRVALGMCKFRPSVIVGIGKTSVRY